MPVNSRSEARRRTRPKPRRRFPTIVILLAILLTVFLLRQMKQQPESQSVPNPPIASASKTTSSGNPARLTRKGNQLLLDGKPYRYVGVNAYGLNGQETGHAYSPQEIDGLFAALPPATVTRTWAWPTRKPESLQPILESAERHNQLLILSLSEGAGYSDSGDRDSKWYESGYKEELLPWIDKVVPMYKDSRAIGMWELINEPGNKDSTQGDVDPKVMKDFFDTVAARIKDHDPNHLVETGTMDSSQAGTQDWVALNSSNKIDVVSIHEYADEYENGIIVSKHFTDVAEQNKKINKPVIIGEVGVRGADSNCVRSREERVNILRRKFDSYFAAGVSGINLWNWFPTKKDDCKSGQNLYNGDPAMELLRSYMPTIVSPPPSTKAKSPSSGKSSSGNSSTATTGDSGGLPGESSPTG